MPTYQKLTISELDNFIFGVSPNPVALKNGLIIGGGLVYPELNFTLPTMEITTASMPEVNRQYQQMIDEACTRACELSAASLVVEFELLPELTIHPEWGADVTRILKTTLSQFEEKKGIKTALRVTPNDIREFERPPLMRSGSFVDNMFASFEQCAQAGADMLAIESTGGKELHDDAILQGDLFMSVFALGILGARDMEYLWDRIVKICHKHNIIPSGDSACGFANTAMVLAERRYVPKVWAALIRVMAAPRSLVAFERGAVGPSKDCAYEGVYLKAITGCPIALEGAESACAHLSSIGNITKAVADLWSNESVQNVKLLSAMAPTVSVEQLIYATRLMNIASAEGRTAALTLRDWFAKSDAKFDPQAYVLRPDVAMHLAAEIISASSPYARTRRAALATLALLRKAHAEGEFALNKSETRWLNRLSKLADNLPEDEDEFIHLMLPQIQQDKINLGEYGLSGIKRNHKKYNTGEDK